MIRNVFCLPRIQLRNATLLRDTTLGLLPSANETIKLNSESYSYETREGVREQLVRWLLVVEITDFLSLTNTQLSQSLISNCINATFKGLKSILIHPLEMQSSNFDSLFAMYTFHRNEKLRGIKILINLLLCHLNPWSLHFSHSTTVNVFSSFGSVLYYKTIERWLKLKTLLWCWEINYKE